MFDGVYQTSANDTPVTDPRLGKAIEIKWLDQEQIHIALVWFNERSVAEIKAKPLNETLEALLYSAQRNTVIQKDAWPLVNELRKRYAELHDGIDNTGEIVPAHRRFCAHTGNETYRGYFRRNNLQDPSPEEAAVQYCEAATGALITAKSYTNNMFNRELGGDDLRRLAEKRAVPLLSDMRGSHTNSLPDIFRPFVVAMKSA